MYSVSMYASVDGCRMHQFLDYEDALRWVYDTKPAYTSVYVNGELVCKHANLRAALAAIVRHHHAIPNNGRSANPAC